MINLIFTPVDESLPELIEFSSSYAGAWKSDWVYIITKSGEIESARLSVSGNRPKPVGQDIREGGKWESCLHDHPPQHKMVKYSPVIGWAYTSDIRELASAPKAAQGELVESAAKDAIMGAAYDFRDAHISGSMNLKRSAHAALEAAVDSALVALAAPQQEAQESCGWDGAEEWEKLAWHLCAEENGEDACNELIWEGGPMPEPWGDRWLKYEGEARRMIALVRTHVPAPQPAPAPLSDDTERLEWLLWKLPGDALRYVVGELADTSSGAEFRAAIDTAIAAQGGE